MKLLILDAGGKGRTIVDVSTQSSRCTNIAYLETTVQLKWSLVLEVPSN